MLEKIKLYLVELTNGIRNFVAIISYDRKIPSVILSAEEQSTEIFNIQPIQLSWTVTEKYAARTDELTD